MNKRYWLAIGILMCGFLTKAQSFNGFAINGSGGSFPTGLVVFDGKLYFSATDSTHGFEPWVSDETTNGTHLLADIFIGSGNSFPQSMTVDSDANLLFFQANDSVHGAELWVTNGDSTRLLLDINPGENPSLPQNMFMYNHKLYFQADDGRHGPELWVSDGTVGGTQMVTDINTTQSDSAGSFPSAFAIYNGLLYFSANDGTHGYELWVTDGTANGTHLVYDIYPGTFSASPADLTVFNGKLYFSATDSVNGTEMWSTDGTTTQLVFDFNAGYQSSNPQGLTPFNGKLYFQADDGIDGPELWSLNGSGTGAQIVNDIYQGPTGSYPQGFILYQGKLFFQATDSLHGTELWSTDGTNAGTVMVQDIVPGLNSSSPAHFIIYHGNLYFIAQPDSVSGDELFVTNGTANGTLGLILTGAPLNPLGGCDGLTLYNNSLAFGAFFDGTGQQLWFFDDAPAAIAEVPASQNFALYPNPCRDHFIFNGFTTGNNYTIRLTDLEGRILQTEQLAAFNRQMQFIMPPVTAGIYLVQVLSGSEVTTLRLVKND